RVGSEEQSARRSLREEDGGERQGVLQPQGLQQPGDRYEPDVCFGGESRCRDRVRQGERVHIDDQGRAARKLLTSFSSGRFEAAPEAPTSALSEQLGIEADEQVRLASAQ